GRVAHARKPRVDRCRPPRCPLARRGRRRCGRLHRRRAGPVSRDVEGPAPAARERAPALIRSVAPKRSSRLELEHGSPGETGTYRWHRSCCEVVAKEAVDMTHDLTVRFLGVRGSIATPGMAAGGNTACVEVVAGDTRIILDAGTGLRQLGNER